MSDSAAENQKREEEAGLSPEDGAPASSEVAAPVETPADAGAPADSPEQAEDRAPAKARKKKRRAAKDDHFEGIAEAPPSPAEEIDAPDTDALVPILEAVLFASPAPLSPQALRKVFAGVVEWEEVSVALDRLKQRCDEEGRGILLCEIAGGWQFLTREEHWPYVQRIARVKHEDRLTPSAIETLSVVAYKQPVTRADVDAIRGVSSGALIRMLMDRGLVRVIGRAETVGHPFQYGTTPKFLQHFGLRSVKDLPDPRDLGRLLSEREEGGELTGAGEA